MDGVPSGDQIVGTGSMSPRALVDVPVTDETIAPCVVRPLRGAVRSVDHDTVLMRRHTIRRFPEAVRTDLGWQLALTAPVDSPPDTVRNNCV